MPFKSGIDEEVHLDFSPVPLRLQEPVRLARVVAALQENVLTHSKWDLRSRETYLTLRKRNSPYETISVFLDSGGLLARHPELRLPFERQRDAAVAVGVELTHHDPITRHSLRSSLTELFGDNYCDPRLGARKICVKPGRGHFLDVVFLPKGPCREELAASELRVELVLNRLRREAETPR